MVVVVVQVSYLEELWFPWEVDICNASVWLLQEISLWCFCQCKVLNFFLAFIWNKLSVVMVAERNSKAWTPLTPKTSKLSYFCVEASAMIFFFFSLEGKVIFLNGQDCFCRTARTGGNQMSRICSQCIVNYITWIYITWGHGHSYVAHSLQILLVWSVFENPS